MGINVYIAGGNQSVCHECSAMDDAVRGRAGGLGRRRPGGARLRVRSGGA